MLTYLDFLIYFIFLPLLCLVILNLYEIKKKKPIKQSFRTINPIIILITMSIIALVYTTPWDNYLVANSIWVYEIDQILGIIIGFVPLEEYVFFVVQPFLVGMFIFWLFRYKEAGKTLSNNRFLIKTISLLIFFVVWLGSLLILFSDYLPGRYISLIISWSFPPIMIQLAFGADILWNNRFLVFLAILTSSLYLSIVDAFAIFAGVWTIEIETSMGILIGNILPFEEILFFFVTNSLIVSGIVLVSDKRSKLRLDAYIINLKTLWKRSVMKVMKRE